MSASPNLAAARKCIEACLKLLSKGEKERRLRDTFTSYLREVFPDAPWWIEDHIQRGEASSACTIAGQIKRGFVDNLVGLTAIEYESDLKSAPKWKEGLHQMREYCAGLVNAGSDPDLVVGILSDTIRWHAFKIVNLNGRPGKLGPDDVELELLEQIELEKSDEVSARRLVKFLLQYMGRLGARRLGATTIAHDLGFASRFCSQHATAIRRLVSDAFTERPEYARLIQKLWSDFVTPVSKRPFDLNGYADELYILTLAKLICANIIEKRALVSDDQELGRILGGDFFEAKGLKNLVEYDYFGWLNTIPHIKELVPIAQELQNDLRAYDFISPPAEDLFGQLVVQLAHRSQRILLGQEWTPKWLAEKLAAHVLAQIPAGTDPQLIDMACGSGAIVVEVVKAAKGRLAKKAKREAVESLTRVITGFDIDPLAVLLAKISWILAARDWLEPFDGRHELSIPIYHADSLFAITPLAPVDLQQEMQTLGIADQRVSLPTFLLSPDHQLFFDAIIDRAYSIAMSASKRPVFSLSEAEVAQLVRDAVAASKISLSGNNAKRVAAFVFALAKALDFLQRAGRNGLWAFILRNSYRPALVAGQFNGLVSNPPWLALSKVADNPYKRVLSAKAADLKILPRGETHLHTELATIFLLNAVGRYLRQNAIIGCILPDSVLNGKQHDPFRRGEFLKARPPIPFQPTEIWRADGAFTTNEAIILFGIRLDSAICPKKTLPGARVGESSFTRVEFRVVDTLDRLIWTDASGVDEGRESSAKSQFRQGADVFPRRTWFHETRPNGRTFAISSIDRGSSALRYLVTDEKECKDFIVTARSVPERYFFRAAISKLLSPFILAEPPLALLPLKRTTVWEPLTMTEIAASPDAKAVFAETIAAFGKSRGISNASPKDVFDYINSARGKLVEQMIPAKGYLVVSGAGGKWVCGAYTRLSPDDSRQLIIDQTLYWAVVETENEARYLTGLINSEAINIKIRPFQPKGKLGERHIHKLPFRVIPPFNPSDAGHQKVVETTRDLIAEFLSACRTKTELAILLDPCRKLDSRRTALRGFLKNLKSYRAYEAACAALL